MLDPISAFAAITAGHKTIMGAIKIGKDLSSLSTAIGKYACVMSYVLCFYFTVKLVSGKDYNLR